MVERSSIRSAISGTVVGNFMEWFDFGVYGYVTVTLSQLFFQTGDEQLDVLLALLGFAVSFVVRPLGGLVLGPLGDRIGRQKVLFFTMAAMAIATALIGVLPTHAQIGFPAAILLYVLKMVQGFSAGWGESAFTDWGWRVPFLVAIPLGAVAIYFRARTPRPRRSRAPSRARMRRPRRSSPMTRCRRPDCAASCATTARSFWSRS